MQSFIKIYRLKYLFQLIFASHAIILAPIINSIAWSFAPILWFSFFKFPLIIPCFHCWECRIFYIWTRALALFDQAMLWVSLFDQAMLWVGQLDQAMLWVGQLASYIAGCASYIAGCASYIAGRFRQSVHIDCYFDIFRFRFRYYFLFIIILISIIDFFKVEIFQ